jgi:glycine/D-amino acid oxidase-like deaminating enzyme
MEVAAGPVIIGGGLAGGLLALALRELGSPVTLIDAATEVAASASTSVASATAISYGAVPGWPLAPTPLARLAAGAPGLWRRLQHRHGALGWRPAALRLHGENPALRGLSRLGVLPFGQVDTTVLDRRWPQLLAAAGVQRISVAVDRLAWQPAGGVILQLSDGRVLQATAVVLAAGSGCRRLWPALPSRLHSSWAGVLELPAFPAALGPRACWLPQRFARVPLERRAAQLQAPAWVLDPGLVPRADGALLGQLTLVRPDPDPGQPPEAAAFEQQLRQALAAEPWSSPLSALPGQLRQAAVAFCSDGVPLVGPVAEGIWAFTGFSAGFSQVPVLAPLLARCLLGAAHPAAAQAVLRRLGLWPAQPGG